jgi:hypothetical protein
MVELPDWDALVSNRSDDFDALSIQATVAPSGASWSGPFRVIGSDGHDYFVKSLQTCPLGQEASLAIEHVVARVGSLIGAPVCSTSLILITADIAGWEPRPGVPLQEGLAHASRALEHCDEQGRPNLAARSNDDNAARHAGVYALFDWCSGSDQQWLYDLDDDSRIYSHDHGLYFPPANNGSLDESALIGAVDLPSQLPDPPTGLSKAACETIADALDNVTRGDLAAILNSIPASWPVSNAALQTLGWYLERRAPAVATRVRSLV